MFETPESSASYLAAFHFMILRGAAGVLIGMFYGLLVYVLVYPLTHIGLDYEHPGPLIPDAVGWANLATLIAGLTAGAAGALVGLVVGLIGPRKLNAAIIGFIGGLVVLLLITVPFGQSVIPSSRRDAISLLVTVIVLPVGLSLMSMVVAGVANLIRRLQAHFN